MTCKRAKNSMTEEVVNWEIPLHVGLWGWEFFPRAPAKGSS